MNKPVQSLSWFHYLLLLDKKEYLLVIYSKVIMFNRYDQQIIWDPYLISVISTTSGACGEKICHEEREIFQYDRL